MRERGECRRQLGDDLTPALAEARVRVEPGEQMRQGETLAAPASISSARVKLDALVDEGADLELDEAGDVQLQLIDRRAAGVAAGCWHELDEDIEAEGQVVTGAAQTEHLQACRFRDVKTADAPGSSSSA